MDGETKRNEAKKDLEMHLGGLRLALSFAPTLMSFIIVFCLRNVG